MRNSAPFTISTNYAATTGQKNLITTFWREGALRISAMQQEDAASGVRHHP